MEESAKQETWTHATSKESKVIKQTTTTTSKGSMSMMEEESRVEEVEQEEVLMARQVETQNLHKAALEEVMSVNSFFTAAVFIGLSFNASQTSLVGHCMPGDDVAKHLVVSEVTAFSCFLFSTLIAQGLKLQMNLSTLKYGPPPLLVHHHHGLKKTPPTPPRRPRLLRPFSAHGPAHLFPRHINPRLLHIGMILCALGSIAGTIFLMLAMFNVIQIRLGLFNCDNSWAKSAVYPLFTLVSAGVLSFISPVLYAVITYY